METSVRDLASGCAHLARQSTSLKMARQAIEIHCAKVEGAEIEKAPVTHPQLFTVFVTWKGKTAQISCGVDLKGKITASIL